MSVADTGVDAAAAAAATTDRVIVEDEVVGIAIGGGKGALAAAVTALARPANVLVASLLCGVVSSRVRSGVEKSCEMR